MRKWVVVAASVIACSKGSQPAVTTGSGSAIGSAAPPIAVADAAAAPADASILGDLPGFTLELPANRADIEAAEKLNNEGYAAHKKKDWPAAIAKYTDALKKDAGHLLARYNLASVYHSSGDDTRALALLAQFKQPTCRACDAILLHVKTDSEWKALRENAEFKALVDGVKAEKVDLKKLTASITAAMDSGKLDTILSYVHPHAPLRERELVYGPPEEQMPWTTHYGVAEFQDFVNKLPKKFGDNGAMDEPCKKNCCRGGTRGDSSYAVDEICFSMIGGVPFISSIEIDPGSI